jgi:hypothetical protein
VEQLLGTGIIRAPPLAQTVLDTQQLTAAAVETQRWAMLGSSTSGGSGGSSQSPLGSMTQLPGGGGSLTSGSSGSGGSPTLLPPLDHPQFVAPRRPNLGREGRPILLRANHFQVKFSPVATVAEYVLLLTGTRMFTGTGIPYKLYVGYR